MIREEEVFKIGQFHQDHRIGLIAEILHEERYQDTIHLANNVRVLGIFQHIAIRHQRQLPLDAMGLGKLEDVNSEEDARMFVGKEVFYPLDAVDEEDLVGDMTWDSFIGYTVTDVQKGYLGEITDVDETTINVLLRVDHKGEELLIPAVEELITEADHEARSLTVSLPEGLIDL